jgi:hypothetical protein
MVFYDNQGEHHKAGVGIEYTKRPFNIGLQINVGEMDKIWGMIQEDYFEGVLKRNYRF